eukprot:GHRR01023763.1.p1 GENE.GHRR01023763.1~~GHRR01023763.1.p1  ORF type:complete len:114 (+),score=22.42 GHRR01023763.1:459-800(+)
MHLLTMLNDVLLASLCRDPIDRMISHFTATFRPNSYEEGYSLAITGGRNGARLTHSHERQASHTCTPWLLSSAAWWILCTHLPSGKTVEVMQVQAQAGPQLCNSPNNSASCYA